MRRGFLLLGAGDKDESCRLRRAQCTPVVWPTELFAPVHRPSPGSCSTDSVHRSLSVEIDFTLLATPQIGGLRPIYVLYTRVNMDSLPRLARNGEIVQELPVHENIRLDCLGD